MSRRPVSQFGTATGASLPGQGQTWTNSIPARWQKSRQAAA